MKSPFPGMDPYLEHHALWPDVHNRLIAAVADFLGERVAPNYYVRLESRAYVVHPDPEDDEFLGRPDIAVASPKAGPAPTAVVVAPADEVTVVEVELPIPDEIDHYYLEIRSVQTHNLITAVELLSPVNKNDPRGRKEYQYKRREFLLSATNYIEIDLLRAGRPLSTHKTVVSDYRILVSRGWTRRKAHLYAFNLRTPIPEIPLPLRPDDEEPTIPLNDLLHQTYTRARFDLQIDYTRPAVPPLSAEQADWAADLRGG